MYNGQLSGHVLLQGFTAICDATIALLIYAVKWAFISDSVGENRYHD